MNNVRQKFENRAQAAIEECRRLGYTPTYMIQMISRYGGAVAVAKRLVVSGDIQDGLMRICRMGRPDLSLEGMMLEDEFESIFTKDELSAAEWRLNQAMNFSKLSA